MTERITSRKNPLLQQTRRLLASRKAREESGLFVADGTKLLGEAVRWFSGLETVILSEGTQAPELPGFVRRVEVPRDVMEDLSPMKAPQGALFLCRIPEEPEFMPQGGLVILDGIQDPGNLGTILRTADALEVPVALTDGCADLYNWKTVRASMGALFRSQPPRLPWQDLTARLKAAGIPLAVTALSTRAEDIRTADLSKCAVVIGSEGQGARRELLDLCDRELIIPMNPRCESLNAAVAAAIVLWQIRQGR